MKSFRIASIVFLSCLASIAVLSPPDGLPQYDGKALFLQAKEIQTEAVTREDRESALKKFEEALHIFQTTNNEAGIKMTLMNMAYLYGTLNEHRKALQTYEQCLVLVK